MKTTITTKDIISVIKNDNRFQGNQKSYSKICEAISRAKSDKNNLIEFAKEVKLIIESNSIGHTFDIVFNDDSNSNNKGFELSLEDAIAYITRYNGTNESYFQDYKGGLVQVVCNQTEEVIYQESVK